MNGTNGKMVRALVMILIAGAVGYLNLSCERSDAIISDGTVDSPAIQVDSSLQLIKLYNKQQEFFSLFQREEDSTTLQAFVYTELFAPNRYVLAHCFGYDSLTYYAAQLRLANDHLAEVARASKFYASINFDSLLTSYEEDFAKFVEHRVIGKFYFSYFPERMCNFCGCDKESMQMDLLSPGNLDENHLKILIPHELNHNLFEVTQNDTSMQETVLYKSIDEGFANYVSQQFAGSTVEEAFGMSESEYSWYLANETAIKSRVKPILYSKIEEDWDPLGEKNTGSFMEGSPGNIGYFIGYRIVEGYLRKIGKDNWRKIYTTPVEVLLAESEWLN